MYVCSVREPPRKLNFRWFYVILSCLLPKAKKLHLQKITLYGICSPAAIQIKGTDMGINPLYSKVLVLLVWLYNLPSASVLVEADILDNGRAQYSRTHILTSFSLTWVILFIGWHNRSFEPWHALATFQSNNYKKLRSSISSSEFVGTACSAKIN